MPSSLTSASLNNDGLMTLFFLVMALEVKRELQDGVLSERHAAALPVAAALGGVLIPAALYLALDCAPDLRRGWAIPTATDIAFAVGALSLLGSRVPPTLRAFLLTLAVVDDLVAVMVIAGYYTADVKPAGLVIVLVGVLAILAVQRLGSRNALVHVLPGATIWWGLKDASVHPSVAGVVLGLLTPSVTCAGTDHVARHRLLRTARRALWEVRSSLRQGERTARDLTAPFRTLQLAKCDILPPAVRIEALLHPWVAFGLMPLFALANAGVAFPSVNLAAPHAATLVTGILLALTLGKPLGILLGTWLCTRTGLSALPEGITWRHMLVLACLGGIGFTMSIFIGNLAFTAPSLLVTAKVAVLVASALSACAAMSLGWLVLGTGASRRLRGAPPRPT